MYPVSEAYKQAVKNGAKQLAVILFEDALFTNEDINISSSPLRFEERFNENEDLTIGTCPSSTISFDLVNEDKFLRDYHFGEFRAYIGVLTDSSNYTKGESTYAIYYTGNRLVRFEGNRKAPYLTMNGRSCPVQPDFPVSCIFIKENVIYCFGEENRVLIFEMNGTTPVRWSDDRIKTAINRPMLVKGMRYVSKGIGACIHGNHFQIWYQNKVCETYELMPLGVFISDRPTYLSKITVSVEASDRMKLLDRQIEERDIRILTQGANAGDAVKYIAEKFGIPYRIDNTLPNGDLRFVHYLSDSYKSASFRDILGYYAGVVCSVARFDRNGILHMSWLKKTALKIDENDYSDFAVRSYKVNKIEGFALRNSYTDKDDTSGNVQGNTYILQNNPFIFDNESVTVPYSEMIGGLGWDG